MHGGRTAMEMLPFTAPCWDLNQQSRIKALAPTQTCSCPLSNRWLRYRAQHSVLCLGLSTGQMSRQNISQRSWLQSLWIVRLRAGALAGLQLQLPAKVALRVWCNVSSLSHNQNPSVCFYVKTDVGCFVLFFKMSKPVVSKLIELLNKWPLVNCSESSLVFQHKGEVLL